MRKSKRWWKRLMTWFCVLLVLWLGAIGTVWVVSALVPAPGEYDAIIVLGAQVLPSGAPNRILNTRLEMTLALYREKPCLIVCTGAKGSNEPAPEGEVMRQWLIDHGVPEQDVLAETESYNTYQNLENAKALLPEGITRPLIVTSDYHLPRALWIARDKGLDAGGAGSPTYWLWRFKNHTREALSWGKYLLVRTGVIGEGGA